MNELEQAISVAIQEIAVGPDRGRDISAELCEHVMTGILRVAARLVVFRDEFCTLVRIACHQRNARAFGQKRLCDRKTNACCAPCDCGYLSFETCTHVQSFPLSLIVGRDYRTPAIGVPVQPGGIGASCQPARLANSAPCG